MPALENDLPSYVQEYSPSKKKVTLVHFLLPASTYIIVSLSPNTVVL